jgi:hypothetical protein
MGILLVCNDVRYSCGYTRWDGIREELANASVRYLRSVYDGIFELNDEQNAYIQTELEKLFEYISTNNVCTTTDFGYFFINKEFVNTFIYFHLGGIYALLNKSDYDGYYSVGNSVDIVKTLEFIENYIEIDDVKFAFYDIRKVFEESVQSGQMVDIM